MGHNNDNKKPKRRLRRSMPAAGTRSSGARRKEAFLPSSPFSFVSFPFLFSGAKRAPRRGNRVSRSYRDRALQSGDTWTFKSGDAT